MKNPVMIITKGYISEELAQRLANINLEILIMYTFSGISEIFENRKEALQIKSMENISKYKNLKLINYYRPVIEGINTNAETIERVAKIVTKYCRASIVSGIRLNKHLFSILESKNIVLPKEYDPDHKVLLLDTFKRINDIFEKVDSNYPTFKKTSCGVSYLLERPDYNGHSARIFYCKPSCKSYAICIGTNKIGFCKPNCPNYKICKEESEKIITPEEFKELLKLIDAPDAHFEILDHYIKLDGTYWQEEVSFLRHKSKKNVKADNLLKRPDEAKLSEI